MNLRNASPSVNVSSRNASLSVVNGSSVSVVNVSSGNGASKSVSPRKRIAKRKRVAEKDESESG